MIEREDHATLIADIVREGVIVRDPSGACSVNPKLAELRALPEPSALPAPETAKQPQP